MDLTHWREFDQFWEALARSGCLQQQGIGLRSHVLCHQKSCILWAEQHIPEVEILSIPVTEPLQLIHLNDSHTICSLLYTATWNTFATTWRMAGDSNEQLGACRRRMEDGPKALFFWQRCLIWRLHKIVGSLYGDAGGIVIKNRSTETLFWLNLPSTFSHKVTKYLKIKTCSNTETYWNSLVQHCVCILFLLAND